MGGREEEEDNRLDYLISLVNFADARQLAVRRPPLGIAQGRGAAAIVVPCRGGYPFTTYW